MRIGRVLLCAGAVTAVTACAGGDRSGASGEYPVNIVFTCSNGGALIKVVPWRVNPKHSTDHIRWNLTGGGKEQTVTIEPKDPKNWPLVDPPPTITNGSFVNTRGVKLPGFPPATYKYNVKGVCINGADADTVVLDPDMIIPY